MTVISSRLLGYVRLLKCFGPLEAAHVSIDKNRYDLAEWMWRCWTAQGPNWKSKVGYDGVETLLRKLSPWAALTYFHAIVAKCFMPLEAVHVSIEKDRYDVSEWMWRCWPAQGLNWTSQISYDVVESILHKLFFWAALAYFYVIVAKCFGPLKAAHVSIYSDRYDVAEWMWRCWRAQGKNWTSQNSYDIVPILLSSANILLWHRSQVFWAIRSGSCEYWRR